MNNKTNNELIILGIGTLILGIILGIYSIYTYSETKELSSKIDFELIDDNNELSSTDKYYKYISIADYLNQKLANNKDLAIKNTSCIYVDYAQHNAVELYKLTNRKLDMNESQKNVAAGNVRSLLNMMDNYTTCPNSATYKSELQEILTEIQKEDKAADNEERLAKFLNSYKRKTANDNKQENLPKLEPIQNEPIMEDYSQYLPEKDSQEYQEDYDQ